MRPISRSTSTYIFKHDYILLYLSHGVSDFVVGPKMRDRRVTTARPEILLISAYQLADFFLFQWRLI